MPYCIDCGVKVVDNSISCPLCQRELDYPESKKKILPYYPKDRGKIIFLKVKKTNPIVVSLITFFTTILSIIPLGIDIISDGQVTWSLYTTSTFIYLYITGLLIALFLGRGFIIYTCINLNTALYLFILDSISPGANWFTKYALTGFIFLQVISLLTALVVRILSSRLLRSSIIVLSVGIFLIVLDTSIRGFVSWSIITGAILLPTSLFLAGIKLAIKDNIST